MEAYVSFPNFSPTENDSTLGAIITASSRVLQAVALAFERHTGQLDKAGKPYILHPLRVMTSVKEHGDDAMIVAVSHDLVEDTETTLAEIREKFGDVVADGVLAVTRLDPKYAYRLGFTVETKEVYRDFVVRSGQNPLGKLVKIADLRDNLTPARMAALPPEEQGIARRYHRALQALGAE